MFSCLMRILSECRVCGWRDACDACDTCDTCALAASSSNMNALAKTPSRFLREELREEGVVGAEEDLQVCVHLCAPAYVCASARLLVCGQLRCGVGFFVTVGTVHA